MKPIRLAVFLFFVAGSLAGAQVNKDIDCGPQIEKALDAAGVKEFLDQLPAQVRSEVDDQLKSSPRLDPANRRVVMRTMLRMFDPPSLERGLKQAYSQSCDPDMLQTVVATLDTPLGKRMKKLEVFAASEEGTRQTAEYRRELTLHPASDVRYGLAERLDQLTGGSEFAMSIAVSIAKGTAAAIGRPVTDSDIFSLRTQAMPFIRSGQIISALFTYRDVSDEDLKQYVAMYENPAMQQFTKTFESAFVDAMSRQSQSVASDRRPQ